MLSYIHLRSQLHSYTHTTDMPSSPIPRDVVEHTVALYGQAWTTQCPELLSEIFTSDVVYIERVFDRKATFVGLPAVIEYWERQIGGKQSNIAFRHLPSRMIRDADQPIAIVHWLAEMDNRREHRGPDKTYKRVHFAQMARLTFVLVKDNNNNNNMMYKVCELQEYAQPMTGPGVQWPGLHRPEHEYAAWLRMESSPTTTAMTTTTTTTNAGVVVVRCHYCQQGFPSRSQLFKHLSTTTPASETIDDKNNNNTIERPRIQPCQVLPHKVEWIWISMSVGYTTHQHLLQRIKELVGLSFPVHPKHSHKTHGTLEEEEEKSSSRSYNTTT